MIQKVLYLARLIHLEKPSRKKKKMATRIPPRKDPPVKLKSVSYYKKKLDKVFSDYIRQRDDYTCITCGKKGDKTNIQNGHYVSRASNSLRYSEVNCNAQCVGCNIFRRGAMDDYAIKLVAKWGKDTLTNLAAEKKKRKEFTRQELIEEIKRYTEKLRGYDDRGSA